MRQAPGLNVWFPSLFPSFLWSFPWLQPRKCLLFMSLLCLSPPKLFQITDLHCGEREWVQAVLVGEEGLLRGWKLDLELEKAKKWLLAALGFWHGTPYHQPTCGTGEGGLSRVDRILKLVQYHENQGVWAKPGTSLLECTCLVTVSGHWP